jgi:hypothetical protein
MGLTLIEEICDTPAKKLASQVPKTLASRKLGRQSAEREQVSEIRMFFK